MREKMPATALLPRHHMRERVVKPARVNWTARGCCCYGDQMKARPHAANFKRTDTTPRLYETARVVAFLIL